jgi:hypothetical protein
MAGGATLTAKTEDISGVILDALVQTFNQNKLPKQATVLAVAFLKVAGGDVQAPLRQTFPDEIRQAVDDGAAEVAIAFKRWGNPNPEEQHVTPLAIDKGNIEGFVLSLVQQLNLSGELVPTILGLIQAAGGDINKPFHLPTLSAHMTRQAARYGYSVDVETAPDPKDVPINITGAPQ